MVQPLVVSRCVTLVVTALHVSVAVTCKATLASVGGLVGLQPRLLPVGTVKVGGVLSDDQLYTTVLEAVLLHASVAVTVNVRVMVQPLVESRCITLVVTALHISVAVTCKATLASVGGLVGLQPRLLPVGTVNVGGAVSDVQLYT